MEFPNDKFKAQKDRYSKARGGTSKFLYITCGNCEDPVLIYQKDGPGRLLRMYANRIVWPPELVEQQEGIDPSTIKQAGALACLSCNTVIATPTLYEQENRPAYRVIPGTIHAYRSAEQATERRQNGQ